MRCELGLVPNKKNRFETLLGPSIPGPNLGLPQLDLIETFRKL